mgnify:CR=1 FL=1
MENNNSVLSKLQENSTTIKKNWTKVRFLLDSSGSRNVNVGTNKVSFPFKSFWVSDSSDTSFKVDIVVNPDTDQGDPLPLRPNMSVNFDSLQKGAVLIFPSQSAKWIEITFSHNGGMDSGSVAVTTTGNASLSDGDDFTSRTDVITDVESVTMAPSSHRVVATIENRGAEKVYLGSLSAIQSVDYQGKCLHLDSG